jgi:hypothetical protein
MPQGLVQPNNSIVYAGYPKYMEYEIKTATDCYPGRLVITDTNEWCVKVAGDGATTVLGVLDVEPNELRETIYDAGDQARVITGDCIVMLQKTSGATIAIGTRVEAAASGRVSELADEDAEIGYSLQAASGDDHEWILVKLTI